MVQVSDWMKQAIDVRNDEVTLAVLRSKVGALMVMFPLPTE
jgi:hypothetical protein